MSKAERKAMVRKFEIDMTSGDFCTDKILSKAKDLGESDLLGMDLRFLVVGDMMHVFSPRDNYALVAEEMLSKANLKEVGAGKLKIQNGTANFSGITRDILFDRFVLRKEDSDYFLVHNFPQQHKRGNFDLKISAS